ncbi:MAG: hypothetical protein R3D71_11045 [Rickettsiales bacterium]
MKKHEKVKRRGVSKSVVSASMKSRCFETTKAMIKNTKIMEISLMLLYIVTSNCLCFLVKM